MGRDRGGGRRLRSCAVFLIYRAEGFSGALSTLSGILRPFIFGAVLAYLVTPLSNSLAKKLKGKHDGLANVLALAIVLAVILAILLLIVPKLIDSIVGIAQALPAQAEALGKKITAVLEKNPDLQATWEEIYVKLDNEAKNMFSGSTGGNGGVIADSAMKVLGGAAGGRFYPVVGRLVKADADEPFLLRRKPFFLFPHGNSLSWHIAML